MSLKAHECMKPRIKTNIREIKKKRIRIKWQLTDNGWGMVRNASLNVSLKAALKS